MEAKLSLRMTISPASLATSVPLPIAKPTSAFFRAGASLIPSPVMPTTSSISCAMRTRRLLSVGRARATTRSRGRRFLICSSLMPASSPLVRTASSDLPFAGISPASRAIAAAVSRLSPVIITTCTPAPCTCWIAARASGRISSRMPTKPMRIRRENCPDSSTGVSDTANASTRIASRVISAQRPCSSCWLSMGQIRPSSS